MRGAGIAAAVVALLLGAALPASAETVATVQGEILAGPVPAGPAVVWVDRQGEAAPVVWRAQPGAAPVALATLTLPAGPYWDIRGLGLAASATTWAVAETFDTYDPPDNYKHVSFKTDVLSGQVAGGEPTVLESCDDSAGCKCPMDYDGSDQPMVAVSGDAVAYQDVCSGHFVRVREGEAQRRVNLKIDGYGDLAFAGHYLAWFTPDYGIPIVYDLARNKVVVRVPADVYYTSSISLQDDGTIVVAVRGDERPPRMMVASPSRPRGRFVPAPPGPYAYDAQISGNRIVALMERPEANYLGLESSLFAGDLAGRHWRPLARFGSRGGLAEDDDGNNLLRVDHGRLAWETWRCRGATIDIASLDDLEARPFVGDEIGCEAPFMPPQHVAQRHGRLRIRIRCPRPCAGTVEAGFALGPRGKTRFSRAGGGGFAVTVRLPPSFVSALRESDQRLHVFLRQRGVIVDFDHLWLRY